MWWVFYVEHTYGLVIIDWITISSDGLSFESVKFEIIDKLKGSYLKTSLLLF